MLIVVIVLAFVGYEYVYKGSPPPQSVDQATQQARQAAQSAQQALGPAGQQAGQALQQGAEKLKEGAQELGQKAQDAAAARGPQGPTVVDGVDLGLATREAVGRARAALATATDAT